MNQFGKLFTVNIFGESHGESVGVVIDGCPAGMPLSVEDFIGKTLEQIQFVMKNGVIYKNL